MADKLIFPIGFDLDKAVEQAGKDWDGKFADKLEKLIAKRPVNVKLNIDLKKLDNLDAVKQRLAQLKIEPITPETKSAIKQLAAELQTLAKALEQVQKYSKNPTKGAVDASRVALNEAKAKAQAALAAQRASKAEDNLAAARLKDARAANVGAAATRNASKAYHELSGYLQRLTQRMAAYWSIRQVGNFLTSVRDVTAQFELQRVSLGAIIQDQQRANQLFAEIKSFALTSPLKILDLTKYTKQVAAYGIETENLFDTTKMLADISVGLGVDMSRLTLFLGQVFATGYLRASEVRQATEAGIPLVDKLAEKLSEANGRLVSAAEVMDLISKRAISFEQVEEVFKDMTSAGGMFYNMQVKQSQTLFGMWSKLGDAAAMMYDQIGNTEAVNTGMKSLIRFLELMMRNWKTTARVLDTVGMGLIVYVAGLKKAAIASQALSVSEAARLAITKSQVIMTPKLVAAIIGQNKATKLSTVLTKAHTVAMMKQATATGILSRAFWSLSATLLANPWIAAAAAVAGATAALIHFTGNAETASERAEKLNNTVASFKTLEDTTGNLISEYNELIDKTERTASEQKKLSAITHELAKQYPGAITAVGNFGDEIELVADKLNQLYQVEKQARMDNTRFELEQTEKKIKEVEAKIEKYQQLLASGEKTIYKRLGDIGLHIKEVVPLTEEDKGNILKRIDELRFGEDGQSGLLGLQQSAEAARRALGLIPSEAAQAVEKFGAWKKRLTEFNKEVGGAKVRLFDDSTINQFGTLDEALDAAAKKYKEATESLAQYDRTLNKGNIKKLTQDQIDKISAERDEAQAMKELSEEALKYYNAMALILKATSGGTQSDPRLGILQDMVSTLKQVNKEYDELAKKEGSIKALADTQKTYADTFKNMQSLAKKYKFSLPKLDVPTDTKSLTDYLNKIREAMKKLPESDKAVLALQVDIDKLDIDEQQRKIEEQLKRLSDNVSRTKTAKEFYEKILGMTGDYDLAAKVSLSIYGDTGYDLQKQLAEQIKEMTGGYGVEVPISIISADNRIDYLALERFVKSKQKELGGIESNAYKELVKIARDGQKDLAGVAEEAAKLLMKYDDIAQQRVNIEQDASEKIKKLKKAEQIFLASTATEEEKAAYSKRTAKAIAGVVSDKDLKLLKLKDQYLRYFSAIHSLTSKEAEDLRKKVREALFKAFQSGAISADELKRELKAVDEQFQKLINDSGMAMDYLKDGFDGLIRRVRDTADELQSVAAEISKMKSPDDISQGQKDFIDDILGKFGDKTTGSNFAELFSKTNGNLKEMGGLLGNVSGKIGGMANKAAGALGMVDMIIQAVNSTIKGIAQIRDQLNAMRSESNQLDSGFWKGFEYLENFNEYAASGWENLKSGNVVGAVQSTIQSIISIFGTAQAQRVRRANKEIKRQQKLLEQLQYTYSRLEYAADKAFGSDYVNNYQQQIKNLQAQQQAYLKQAEAERSKGKKKDEEKIKEYENAARDTADEIKKMQDELVAHFTGSSKTDIARQMAKSWIDARASMSDTFAAIKGDYADMVKNMLVEGAAARVIENALTPVWDSMQKMLDKNDVQGAIDSLVNGMDSALNAANNGMEVLWKALEARGYDMKKLISDTDSEYTGIAKNVAGATSEEINTAAQIGNTLMYYVSPIPRIDENLARVVALMEGGGTSAIPQATSAGWTDWQQQAMDNYNAIARNTADTVIECRRAAAACEDILSQLGRVIRPKGSPSSHSVSTTIN